MFEGIRHYSAANTTSFKMGNVKYIAFWIDIDEPDNDTEGYSGLYTLDNHLKVTRIEGRMF